MGIFCLNGVYYIRTLFQTSEARWLRALNVIEPDILIRAEDELHCLGKILGRVDGCWRNPTRASNGLRNPAIQVPD